MYKNLGEIKGEILMWLISVKIAEGPVNIAQLVILALWVAITWFIVWAAIESSKLWESWIVKGLKDLTTSALWSMPVIPVPTKNWTEMMWVSTVFGRNNQEGWLISRMTTKFKDQYNEDTNNAINALLDPEKEAKQAESNRLSAYKRELGNMNITADWATTPVPIWEKGNEEMTLSKIAVDKQGEIIETINAMGGEKLKNIPVDHTVNAWGKTYKFVKEKNKYEPIESNEK